MAIRIFRHQVRGVLVNVASAAAYVGQPFMGAYVASKFGIRGAVLLDEVLWLSGGVCVFSITS